MWADPHVTKYIGEPSTGQRSWARLLTYGGLWRMLGFGYWAVEERATGAYVGDVGFADFHREIAPSIEGVPEIGWVLAAPFHRKGYGMEAVRAAIAWGDAHLASLRTVCIVDPQNAASIRLAQKAGYTECAQSLYLGTPATTFQRLRG